MIMPQRLGGFHFFTMEIINIIWGPLLQSFTITFFPVCTGSWRKTLFLPFLGEPNKRRNTVFPALRKTCSLKGVSIPPWHDNDLKNITSIWVYGAAFLGSPVFQAVASIQKPHIKSQLSDQLLSSFCPPNLTSASSRRRSGCKDLNDRKRRVWTLWDWTIPIQFTCLSNETLKCPSTHLDT